ncbi:MAG: hypothetical protein COV67_07080, partial [Nitrospinae bacterium CG11_big_fil_rev_8_21_14_0_20_56_8]
ALVLLGYFAVFFITPYGLGSFLYPFKVFFAADFIGFYKQSNVVQEMLSPAGIFLSFNGIYYFVLFGC